MDSNGVQRVALLSVCIVTSPHAGPGKFGGSGYMSVLDSVGKGGAQGGIENLNIMAGFERTAGLLDRGLHP